MQKKIAILILIFNYQVQCLEPVGRPIFHLDTIEEEDEDDTENYDDPLIWCVDNVINKITLIKCNQFLQYLIKLQKKENVEKYKEELKKDKELKKIIESFDHISHKSDFYGYTLYYNIIYNHLNDMKYSLLKELPTRDQFKELRTNIE